MSIENSEPKEKKNLIVELAKQKAAAQASGAHVEIHGKELASRYPKAATAKAYRGRGGRNGSGKP